MVEVAGRDGRVGSGGVGNAIRIGGGILYMVELVQLVVEELVELIVVKLVELVVEKVIDLV